VFGLFSGLALTQTTGESMMDHQQPLVLGGTGYAAKTAASGVWSTR
jgi:hypothetical protein